MMAKKNLPSAKVRPYAVLFIVLALAAFFMAAFKNIFSDSGLYSQVLFLATVAMGIITLANVIVLNASAPKKKVKKRH